MFSNIHLAYKGVHIEMLGSRNKEETTSVKHVFFKSYHQSSSFELLEIRKCLKLIWLGTAGMKFENTAVIYTLKTESHIEN